MAMISTARTKIKAEAGHPCLIPRKTLKGAGYRPITLLNTDTKILANTIAQRLKEVLPSIIHSDQKGYVKNR
jgi:hypothetical protein